MGTQALVFTIALTAICLSAASLFWSRSIEESTRQVKAGQRVFAIPRSFPQEKRYGNDREGSIILGEMDDGERYYYTFLGICWSKEKIASSTLLPAPAYKKVAEMSSPFSFTIDPHATLTRAIFSATKPCGRGVKEDLGIIEFFDNKTKTYYAISSFMTPVMQKDDLITIARSLRDNSSRRQV